MSDPDGLDAVVARVRERVSPDAAEREALEAIADRLRARAEDAVADLPVEADVLLVGSTARDTWLADDRDLDIFVRFPPEVTRQDLETYGLKVGHAVLPDGHEEYAEHPYVKGDVDGVEVDCVPCYDVDSATEIRSAVDRTPFHTTYVAERLDDDLAGDVRVAKAFLKAARAYGSDLRTRGFSGYLTELLVLEHGGFRGLVKAAVDWTPPVRFDPADHAARTFDDPLVVVDPTDPERNVAAALSARNLARLIHYARDLVNDPRESLFEPHEPVPLSAATVRERVRERDTHPVAIRFDVPDVVEDQLYPQLDRSLAGVHDELARRGFAPVRAERFADDARAVLFIECAVAELAAVERHEGPPIGAREHATDFYEAYAHGDATGPYLDGDRYVVEREREYPTPEALLESDALFDVALGTHVGPALADRDVLVGEDIARLADRFGVELARYFDPVP